MALLRIAPMLAASGDRPDLRRTDHIFEPKWDGTRAVAYIERGRLRLINRRNLDIAHRYPELADVARHVHTPSAILDGEVVVLDERGRPHFEAAQLRDHLQHPVKIALRAEQYPAAYVVFDLLALDGTLHLDEPLGERKALLAKVVEDAPRIVKTYSTPEGQALFEEIARRGWEGVMAKALASPRETGGGT